jgi:hypothetical protein
VGQPVDVAAANRSGYQLDSKTVIRGGYGIYYDTLDVNAQNTALNQTGFSVSTNTTFTTDQGVTWGANGACGGWCNAGATLTSPLTDPFPSRPASGGIRFNVPVANTYGLMGILALSGTPNINSVCNPAGLPCGFDILPSKHLRMQRWRAGIERQLSHHDVVSFGYTGAYTSDQNIEVSRNLLPAQYYYFGNARPVNSSVLQLTTGICPLLWLIEELAVLQPGRYGLAGWKYKDWKGVVSATGAPRSFNQLAYIANYFTTVEVNSSYYGPPQPGTAQNGSVASATKRPFDLQ